MTVVDDEEFVVTKYSATDSNKDSCYDQSSESDNRDPRLSAEVLE